jgi:hypothetical protein
VHTPQGAAPVYSAGGLCRAVARRAKAARRAEKARRATVNGVDDPWS